MTNKCSARGALKCNFPLFKYAGPTDQTTDGAEGPWGSYTSNKFNEIVIMFYVHVCTFSFPCAAVYY